MTDDSDTPKTATQRREYLDRAFIDLLQRWHMNPTNAEPYMLFGAMAAEVEMLTLEVAKLKRRLQPKLVVAAPNVLAAINKEKTNG